MKNKHYLFLILILPALWSSCRPEVGSEFVAFGTRHDRDFATYEQLAVNGGSFTAGTDYPNFSAVGAVVMGESEGSGTLIAPTWVVTAAHVLMESANDVPSAAAASFFIGRDFENPDEEVKVKNIYVHPGWIANLETGDEEGVDIALIELMSVPKNINPFPAYTGSNEPANSHVFVAGYGDYVDKFPSMDQYTFRHAFENTLDRVIGNLSTTEPFSGSDVYKGGVLAFDFDSPDELANSLGVEWEYPEDTDFLPAGDSQSTPLDLEGTSVPGDSGGGLFCYIDGKWQLIGVVSFGTTDSDYGDVAVFTRISSHTKWIQDIMAK